MNLANKLTTFRVVLVPVFVVVLLFGEKLGLSLIATDFISAGIFILASITDLFDGMVARKYNLITNFGKFMDPLADKLLVCSALICLSCIGRIPAWITVIIVCREFTISGVRLVAAEGGHVIAASMWGKVKTFVSMAMLAAVIFDFDITLGFKPWYYFELLLIYASLILTVISLIDYLIKNAHILKEEIEE